MRETILGLSQRLGGAAKFAVKATLNVLLPGSGAAVELVGNLMDCAHQTAKDQWEFDQKKAEELARQADRERLEKLLGLLGKDLESVLAAVSGLEHAPEHARLVVEGMVKHDEKLQAVQVVMRDLAATLARIERNTAQLLDGQDRLLRKVARLEKRVTRIGRDGKAAPAPDAFDEPQEGPSLYDYP